MKLTKTKLKQIIQEEIEDHNLLNEQDIPKVNEKSWVNRDGTPNIAAMKKGLADGGYTKGADGGLQKWLRNRKGQGYLKAFRAYYTAHRKQIAAKAAGTVAAKKAAAKAAQAKKISDEGAAAKAAQAPAGALSRLEQSLLDDFIAIEALAKKKEYANVRQDLVSLSQDITKLRHKVDAIKANQSSKPQPKEAGPLYPPSKPKKDSLGRVIKNPLDSSYPGPSGRLK